MSLLLGNHRRCQAFDNVDDDNDSGSDYAWVKIYNESDTSYPLYDEGDGMVDITGSDAQEDYVDESAITANRTVGENVL